MPKVSRYLWICKCINVYKHTLKLLNMSSIYVPVSGQGRPAQEARQLGKASLILNVVGIIISFVVVGVFIGLYVNGYFDDYANNPDNTIYG